MPPTIPRNPIPSAPGQGGPVAGAPAQGSRAAWRRIASVLAILILANPAPAAAPPETAAAAPVRFGFSRSMFRSVNENDARASLKAYAAMIAQERRILTHPDAIVFGDGRDAIAALRQNAIDLISGTAEEILAIDDALLTGPYLLASQDKVAGTRYVLLVHQESDLTRLGSLRGRRVLVLNSLQGSLAQCWLEVLLAGSGLGPPGEFFGGVQSVAKPTLAALPVFFRQMDACVVTLESLAVIGEMNPQVVRQLRALATSDLFVPAVTCFRRGFDATQKRQVIDAMTAVNLTPAGRQLMTIFQTGHVGVHEGPVLDPTRRLLAERARLRSAQPGAASTPSIIRVSPAQP